MSKYILTDVDSVLLNFDTGLFSWISKKGIGALPYTNADVEFSTRLNLSKEATQLLIDEFIVSEEFAKLKPYKDSQSVIKDLAKQGFKFIAITACGTDSEVKTARRKNLANQFGDVFEDILFTPVGGSKKEHLRRWENSKMLWVEDHVGHAIDGAKLGLRSVLIDHPYNKINDAEHMIYRTSADTPWNCVLNYVLFLEDTKGLYE